MPRRRPRPQSVIPCQGTIFATEVLALVLSTFGTFSQLMARFPPEYNTMDYPSLVKRSRAVHGSTVPTYSVVPRQAGRHLFTVPNCPASTFLGTIRTRHQTCSSGRRSSIDSARGWGARLFHRRWFDEASPETYGPMTRFQNTDCPGGDITPLYGLISKVVVSAGRRAHHPVPLPESQSRRPRPGVYQPRGSHIPTVR